jgi:hypothetical protein
MTMDSRSSAKSLYATEVGVSDAGAKEFVLRRLPHYIFCVWLGLLGGAIGVVLAIGLSILIQVVLPPPVVFAPGAIPLMLAAILFGLGFSWLLSQMANLRWSEDANQNGMRVTVIFSVLTSLLQSLLFFGLV